MPARRDKTLHYRSAFWVHPEETGETLESYTRSATNALPTAEDRTVEHGEDHYIRCLRSRRRHGGGIFLHLTSDTPGEATTTVPKDLSAADVDVGSAPPPPNSEFMDGDAFIFIRGDHVCFCTGVMREGALRHFLIGLFKNADLDENAGAFIFKKSADADKLAMIQAQGVKEIELNATVFAAAAHYAGRQSQPVGFLRSAARVLYSLRDEDNEDRQDNLMLTVSIRADGRVKTNPHLGYERLEDVAEQMLEKYEEGDSFTIVTKDKQKITASKVFLQKPVSIPSAANTVSREPVWQELLTYYQELVADHMIVAP